MLIDKRIKKVTSQTKETISRHVFQVVASTDTFSQDHDKELFPAIVELNLRQNLAKIHYF